jgi:hypothetical protein
MVRLTDRDSLLDPGARQRSTPPTTLSTTNTARAYRMMQSVMLGTRYFDCCRPNSIVYGPDRVRDLARSQCALVFRCECAIGEIVQWKKTRLDDDVVAERWGQPVEWTNNNTAIGGGRAATAKQQHQQLIDIVGC